VILTAAVVLGLLIALARYGRDTLSHIAAIPLHSAWLALLAILLQWPLLRAPTAPIADLRWQQILFLGSHLLLLVFVWRNRRSVGILVLGLGVLCNLLAIAFNGGFMPITPKTLVTINPGTSVEQWPIGQHYGGSKDIILLRTSTQLWPLSDVLVVPPPFPWPTAFSVGDILIAAGIVVVLQTKTPVATSDVPNAL
jgi:hypothetical protein